MLLNSRYLFQEYIVTAYAKVERNRLEHLARNQHLFRSEVACGLQDALKPTDHRSQGSLTAEDVGKPMTILPASFTGSPRYMKGCYLDAMAFLPSFKHPDLFITFTANPR